MNNFISYNQYKKQSVLNETYESFRELESVAKIIYKKFAKFFLFRSRQGVIYPFKKFIDKKFSIIQDFIDNGNIGILYVKINPDKNSGVKACFVPKKSLGAFSNTTEDQKKLLNKYNGIIVIYSMNYISILHELQHAYDYYKSNGKFYNNKKVLQFHNMEKPVSNPAFKGHNKEELEQQIDGYLKKLHRYMFTYSSTPVELSAFFIQTITNLEFFIDAGKQGIYFRDIHLLWDEFKEKYQNYDILTPKIKKDLARKFSQYYHKIKDEYADRVKVYDKYVSERDKK